ncbi:PASTA domain-containing protein, partial [Brucella abortus]
AELDLSSKIVIESSPSIAEGNVIRTDPEGGVSVEQGSTVTLYVSSGEETVVVPKLEGMSLDAATKALQDAGLELGTVTQRNDKGLAANTV